MADLRRYVGREMQIQLLDGSLHSGVVMNKDYIGKKDLNISDNPFPGYFFLTTAGDYVMLASRGPFRTSLMNGRLVQRAQSYSSGMENQRSFNHFVSWKTPGNHRAITVANALSWEWPQRIGQSGATEYQIMPLEEKPPIVSNRFRSYICHLNDVNGRLVKTFTE